MLCFDYNTRALPPAHCINLSGSIYDARNSKVILFEVLPRVFYLVVVLTCATCDLYEQMVFFPLYFNPPSHTFIHFFLSMAVYSAEFSYIEVTHPTQYLPSSRSRRWSEETSSGSSTWRAFSLSMAASRSPRENGTELVSGGFTLCWQLRPSSWQGHVNASSNHKLFIKT